MCRAWYADYILLMRVMFEVRVDALKACGEEGRLLYASSLSTDIGNPRNS
jgi:hypothetical protein